MSSLYHFEEEKKKTTDARHHLILIIFLFLMCKHTLPLNWLSPHLWIMALVNCAIKRKSIRSPWWILDLQASAVIWQSFVHTAKASALL